MQNIFKALKTKQNKKQKSHKILAIQNYPLYKFLVDTIFFSFHRVFPFPGCHTNRIIENVAFSHLPLLYSNKHLRRIRCIIQSGR